MASLAIQAEIAASRALRIALIWANCLLVNAAFSPPEVTNISVKKVSGFTILNKKIRNPEIMSIENPSDKFSIL
jgi:hypothetical protein